MKFNWLLICSCLHAFNYQKTVCKQMGTAKAECKADGWVQFDAEFPQQRRNATWQIMRCLSCSSSPTTNLINPSSAPTVPSTTTIPSTTTKPPPPPHQQDFINLFLQPYPNLDHRAGGDEAQTLELFPLESSGGPQRRQNHDLCAVEEEEEEEEDSGGGYSHVTPQQFFEFLPLKN